MSHTHSLTHTQPHMAPARHLFFSIVNSVVVAATAAAVVVPMRRRPTPDEVKYGGYDATAPPSSASCSREQADQHAVDDDLQVARIRRGRLWSLLLIVAIAMNMATGTVLTLRQFLFYRQRGLSWFEVAWIPQSALVLYAMFGVPVCNPLRAIVPERTLDAHKRKLVLLAFLHALVVGAVVLYDMVTAWVLSLTRRPRRSTIVVMPMIWRIQALLLCAFVFNILYNEFRHYLFPASMRRTQKASAATSAAAASSLPQLPLCEAPGNGNNHHILLPPSPPPPSIRLDKAHSTYYVCPGIAEASLFAFDRPTFLLLALGPMSALELSTIVHYMMAASEEKFKEFIRAIARGMTFDERSVRSIVRKLHRHSSALVTAERALYDLQPTDDFLPTEIVNAVGSRTNYNSIGIVNDLNDLCIRKALIAIDAATFAADGGDNNNNNSCAPTSAKHRALVIEMFQRAWSALKVPVDVGGDAMALVARAYKHNGSRLQTQHIAVDGV